ncbi:carbonic anhydrase [Rhodobium orientis]|uniref:Carbonic anhydrase n=1 Tax=Rhodobium orientis TaxID=34017 RepID=A0A327JKZ3_9HYPH|nr:carbonic anhydrase [Rhodobium orientis]MBB4303634.1 carbonic anhydrase [Rhodobium orientis]MBK5951910.1 carbonate dehydratase [Rhodobium orientis]RAI26761.1 carbonate dehydratase [Rhodobium orientis]
MPNFPSELLDGYRAFSSGRLAAERFRYARLAEMGQKPSVMVIGCCDSRAAPETIFDARPGELFVVRNVANLVPPYEPTGEYHGTSAALEFAVQALKVQHIVVLGHGRCGGIAAFRDTHPEPLSPGDFIGRWIALLEPASEKLEARDEASLDPQTAMEYAGVRQSIENLRTFPYIKSLEEGGKLHLHGAWFDISNGELRVLDKETGVFSAVPAL